MLNRHQTVANLVLDHSECAEVFQRHRIDFCCKGNLSIESAASDRGVDPDALLAELTEAIESRRGDQRADPRELSTPRLIMHIVATHHEYLRSALPFIRTLAAKVSRVHGDHNPKLRELHVTVEELARALLSHIEEEELGLFPTLTARSLDADTAREQLASMHADHHAVAELLERVRAVTYDFSLPEWACNSYRTLFAELEQLEGDVHTHVHLENHVLVPRFVDNA